MRLALCPGRGGKPSVLITADHKLYIGNPTEEEMVVTSQDVMGFYTGAFEIKIIKSCSISACVKVLSVLGSYDDG